MLRTLYVLLFLLPAGLASAQPHQDLTCADVPGLAPALQPGTVVLIGEMHGTNESPRFVQEALCTALQNGHSVTVGLEIPEAESDPVDAFLGSPGDAEATARLLQGSFWQRPLQDGRSSRALLGLIQQVRAYRAEGWPVRLILIDDPTVPTRRDHAMQAKVQAGLETAPTDVFLILTGNVHNRLTRGTRWDAAYEPLGYLLRQALPEQRILSLNVAHTGGEAWVCFGSSPSDCGVRRIGGNTEGGQGVEFGTAAAGDAYQGGYHVGRLTASLPAIGTASTVAVTIDDLPFIAGRERLAASTEGIRRLLDALTRYQAPASGFVTGARVMVEGQVDARLDLLRRWRDGGVRLENHSFSHRSFQQTPLGEYLDDAIQGLLFPEMIMRERGDSVLFYRHPFNHTGPTEEARRTFETFLENRSQRLAPFTVEHADYVFNSLYAAAEQHADTTAMARIGQAYLAQLDSAFAFAERLSQDTFGRAIPQIFLIHANAINAAYLDRMLGRLQERGYRFVSLEEALRDAAYATPDSFVGNSGISWLHRWRIGLGLENRLRDEPDPPPWIIDAYRQHQGQ